MKHQLLILFSLTLISDTAFGWGDTGHQAVAEIAERGLNERGLSFVRSILGLEPMAAAAIWPDIVRSDKRFDEFKKYHMIEIPEGRRYADLAEGDKQALDASVIIKGAPVVLLSENYTRDQKMIMLRYLIHVIGDVHQPLHVGNGLDIGANACFVKWTEPQHDVEELTNLHSLLDDGVIEYIGKWDKIRQKKENPKKTPAFYYPNLADLILNDPLITGSIAKQNVESAKMSNWFDESRALHAQVYPDKQPTTPSERKYCGVVGGESPKSADLSAAPRLDEAYLKRTARILKIQILKAGYRLAHYLNRIAQESDVAVSSPKEFEKSVLGAVLIDQKFIRTVREIQSVNKTKNKQMK